MKLQRARHKKVCNLCGKDIEAGTKYWRDEDPSSGTVTWEHVNCELHKVKVTAQQKDELK